MSNERLKKLAGIETKTVIQEAPKEITLNLGNYRFSDLMEVRMAACVRGGKVTVNESGNRFDVSVTFANNETVNESINDFKKAIGLVVEGEKVPQIDHAEYQEKLKNKTDDQLEFIIKDAQAAIKANPDAPKSQGYYQDEINYARMELNKRKKKPVKEGEEVEVNEASESNFFQSVDDEKNEIEQRMGTEKEIKHKVT